MNTKASTRLLEVNVTVANGRRDGDFCLVQDCLQTDSWIYNGIPVRGIHATTCVHIQVIVQVPDLSEWGSELVLNPGGIN